MHRRQPPVHPFGPVLLALIVMAVFGLCYLLFGIGKDALIFSASALAVFAMPVITIFGIMGIVIGIRRLLRGRRDVPDGKHFHERERARR